MIQKALEKHNLQHLNFRDFTLVQLISQGRGETPKLLLLLKMRPFNGESRSFVFQTCSYRTRPMFFMPCLRRRTLTLFCTRHTRARRSRCQPFPASDDTPSSLDRFYELNFYVMLLGFFFFEFLFNYKYEIVIECQMLFIIQKHFMKQEEKLTFTEDLHK